MEQKKCRTCNKIKPVEDFHIHTKGKLTRNTECKSCKVIRSRVWYKNNPDKRKRYVKKWYAINYIKRRQQEKDRKKKLKDIVLAHYGSECSCCGEPERTFLTIDHKNNDGGIERKTGVQGASFYRKIIEEKFPDRYQILCFNCNLGKYLNGGICPHQR